MHVWNEITKLFPLQFSSQDLISDVIGFSYYKNLEQFLKQAPPCNHERSPKSAKQTPGMDFLRKHSDAQVNIFSQSVTCYLKCNEGRKVQKENLFYPLSMR